jgi:hypothetical protein
VPVTGNTPWVVLECSYADVPSIPATTDVIQTALFGATTSSAAAYWRDNSFGAINLNGSVVDAWQPIRAKANYHTAGGNAVDRPALVRDCIAAHPTVTVTAASRVLVLTNATNGHDSGGYLGGVTGTAFAGGTVLEGANYTSAYLLGQEMGHAYGLNHAWDDQGVQYNDEYDVMGDAGVGITMAERDALGWLAPSRVATRATGLPSYELSAPFHATRPGYDMLRVSDPLDATHHYTVEYRQRESWDATLPVDGVVIHEVRADGTVVLQRSQLQPGLAALTANGSRWTSPNGGVTITLVCHDTTRGTATVTMDPAAYAQCGSGFMPTPAVVPPSASGGGGGGVLPICTTCGPKPKPIRFT